MSLKGLDVRRLDSVGISQLLKTYVSDYFNGYELDEGQSMFQEGHIFYFDEVKGIMPTKYHHLIVDDDKFGGLSGYITVGCEDGQADERIISVLMCECGAYLYLLCVQETDEDGTERTTIIKDFITT